MEGGSSPPEGRGLTDDNRCSGSSWSGGSNGKTGKHASPQTALRVERTKRRRFWTTFRPVLLSSLIKRKAGQSSHLLHLASSFPPLTCAKSAPTAAPSSTKGATARRRSGWALAGAAIITTWRPGRAIRASTASGAVRASRARQADDGRVSSSSICRKYPSQRRTQREQTTPHRLMHRFARDGFSCNLSFPSFLRKKPQSNPILRQR